VRNTIGFHYDERAVVEIVQDDFKDEEQLESTAATVGGLARMADSVVRAIMNLVNGGDFMTDEAHSQKVPEALDGCGHLIAFVDHLFAALVGAHCDAIVQTDERIVVPPLVARATEAVEAARGTAARGSAQRPPRPPAQPRQEAGHGRTGELKHGPGAPS